MEELADDDDFLEGIPQSLLDLEKESKSLVAELTADLDTLPPRIRGCTKSTVLLQKIFWIICLNHCWSFIL